MSSCTNRIAICNNLFALICSQSRGKKTVPTILFFSNIFCFFSNIFWKVCLYLFSCETRFQSSSNYCNKKLMTLLRKTFLFSILWEIRVESLTNYVPVLPSYRNQGIDLHRKSIDWFLYEGNTGTNGLKSIVEAVFVLDLVKCSRKHSPAKFL